MSNEYLPLAKLIEQGLQEGTVLESDYSVLYKWTGRSIVLIDTEFTYDANPLDEE